MKGRSARQHFQTITSKFDEARGESNPFASLVENLCEVNDLDVESLPRPPQPVRIALVSMPALDPNTDVKFRKFDKKRVPAGVDPDDCRLRLVALKRGLHKRWLEAYKEALTFAVNEFHANVICVSELGLPHRNAIPMKEAQAFAKNLCDTHNVLMLAGTSHDVRTRYNTGYVYHPGGGVWAFHKTLSATGMGEYIASPAKRRVLSVKTFGLRIAMMICLDIADYATLASVVRVKDKVDVVLVPCYTEKFDKMLAVAKLASKALQGVVAMVNAHLPEGTCHIARFGKDEHPKNRQDFNSGACVSLFEVEHQALETERNRKQSPRERQHVEWLFGDRDLRRLHSTAIPARR